MNSREPPRPKPGATGPRTPEGRQRAAQNARKHGLTARTPHQAAIAAQLDAWADDPVAQKLPQHMRVSLARARLIAQRVQRHQEALLVSLTDEAGRAEALTAPAPGARSDAGAQHMSQGATDLVAQFRRSMRYRAEAEAQLRKAWRAVALQIEGGSGGGLAQSIFE